jgi:molecular chaperone DnaK
VITASSGLSKDEVDRTVHDAQCNAQDEARGREETEARNQLDSTLHTTERTMREYGADIPQEQRR